MAKGGFPGGLGGGANMQQLMMRAQRMQQDVQRTQAELNEREFTASSGGGMVTVTVSGNKDVRSIVINPACVDPEDVEMLEDMLIAVFNEAVKKVDEMTSTEMGKLTGGMNLPKGMF